MKRYGLFIYFACMLIICACSKNQEQSAVKVETNETKTRFEDLEKRVRKLELDNMFKTFETIAFISVSEKKFATIKTDIGTITFLVDDMKPYANGTKLKLIIGNPINATLKDVKFSIDYGQVDEKDLVIDKSEKTKDINLIGELKKGTWNKEELILSGIQPDKLGYVRIHDFSFSSMSLNN